MGENPYRKAQANYYPPCPDPELTLGLIVHTDICALTVVLQTEQVQGLQVIKDEKWVPVDPIPNAFVINVGDQFQEAVLNCPLDDWVRDAEILVHKVKNAVQIWLDSG
ncbi:hypothetical protein Ancab_034625 [Ancistrocladus abbreviatus]